MTNVIPFRVRSGESTPVGGSAACPPRYTEVEAMLTEEHQADEWAHFGLTTDRPTCRFCPVDDKLPASVRRPDTDTVACGKCALKRWGESGALAYLYAREYAERELRRRDPEWPG